MSVEIDVASDLFLSFGTALPVQPLGMDFFKAIRPNHLLHGEPGRLST